MAIFSMLRAKRSFAVIRGKRMLSFFSENGWQQLDNLPASDGPGDAAKFYDYRFFLREFEKGIKTPLQGSSTGEIPKWLEGSLLQNGPGKFKFGDSEAKHWFDGCSVIQKFKIKDGKASFECQLLNSETLRKNTKANKHVVSEFCTPALPDPCQTIFQRFQSMFSPFVTDNCTVSIYPIDGNLYALTETPKIHQLDVENIRSKGMVDLKNNFHIMSHAAHPHVTKDGSVYNVSLTKGDKGAAYAIYMIPNKGGKGLETNKQGNAIFGEGKLVAKIPCTWPWNPGYMHSFGITDNYFIVIEQPLTISIKSILARPFLSTSLTDAFRWKDLPVNIHVINRNDGERKTYTSDYFFFFHTINQFEEDGHVVIDVCTYDSGLVINSFMVDAMKGKNWAEIFSKTFSGRPLRFVIPTSSEGSGNLVKLSNSSATAEKNSEGTIHLKSEKLCDDFCELPRFHYDKLLGKKYKYFYAVSFSDKINATGKLLKVDTDKKTTTHEWCEVGTAPSEPIFIPSPDAKDEDDGVVIFSLLSSQSEEKVSLIVLNAKDLKEMSRTEFKTPGPIPKPIHGWFS